MANKLEITSLDINTCMFKSDNDSSCHLQIYHQISIEGRGDSHLNQADKVCLASVLFWYLTASFRVHYIPLPVSETLSNFAPKANIFVSFLVSFRPNLSLGCNSLITESVKVSFIAYRYIFVILHVIKIKCFSYRLRF